MKRFHLTPDLMEGAYAFILSGPPFRRWKMPPADEVGFFVLKTPQIHGDCGIDASGQIYIRLSTALVGSTENLLSVTAHEMIHGYQFLAPRTKTSRAEHDAFFWKAADRVCEFHKFDRKTF